MATAECAYKQEDLGGICGSLIMLLMMTSRSQEGIWGRMNKFKKCFDHNIS